MYNYKECFEYVKKTLLESGNNFSKRHPYRSRWNHTLRVLRWAERLTEGLNVEIDYDVLKMAVIFHDVGYANEHDGCHQEESAILFREYAKEHNYDESFVERVVEAIAHHSNKGLLETPELLSLEQILVMEADLLDEEGAHQVAYNALATGYDGNKTYDSFYERCKDVMINKRPNPMVTKKGKELWDEKQKFFNSFVKKLDEDLEESNNF